MCNKNHIVQQYCVKYLRVHIDNKLDYSDHINYLERKVACSVGILRKLKFSFLKEVVLQLYHALVYPHLLYAIPV